MRRLLLVVGVPLLAIVSFGLGAYYAVRKNPGPSRCCGSKSHDHSLARDVPKRTELPHKPRPPIPDAVRERATTNLLEAMASLHQTYGPALGEWGRVPVNVAMNELLWIRLPQFVRDERGVVHGMRATPEAMADPTLNEILSGGSPISEPRHALDAIDTLMERVLEEPNGVGSLLQFLGGNVDDQMRAVPKDFLLAARTRALLALRTVRLDEAQVHSVKNLAAQEADSIARGALYAVLSAHDEVAAVRTWLTTERDPRAVNAMLLDLTRKEPSKSLEGPLAMATQARYSRGSAPALFDVTRNEGFPSNLRALAIAGLGLRIHEEGVLDFLVTGVSAEKSPELADSYIRALGNAFANPKAEQAIHSVLLSAAHGTSVKQSAAVALGNFQSPSAAEALAVIILQSDKQLATAAAAALGKNYACLSEPSKEALRQRLQTETNPAVRAVLEEVINQ